MKDPTPKQRVVAIRLLKTMTALATVVKAAKPVVKSERAKSERAKAACAAMNNAKTWSVMARVTTKPSDKRLAASLAAVYQRTAKLFSSSKAGPSAKSCAKPAKRGSRK